LIEWLVFIAKGHKLKIFDPFDLGLNGHAVAPFHLPYAHVSAPQRRHFNFFLNEYNLSSEKI